MYRFFWGSVYYNQISQTLFYSLIIVDFEFETKRFQHIAHKTFF